MTAEHPHVFVLPATATEGHTLIAGTTAKGKSLIPDHSELTMELVENAFKIIGKSTFKVSACLSVDDSKSLRNFGLLESILLMAYQRGVQDQQAGKVKMVPAGSDMSPFTRASVSEAEALLGNASLRVVLQG